MVPIQAVGNPFNKPVEAVRPETTGAMASRPVQRTNIFASAGVSVPSSIFGNPSSSVETSGSVASSGNSGSSGGGNTIAVA